MSLLGPLAAAAAAFCASLIGSVAGSGGTPILMSVLVLQFGARAAVPITSTANLIANISRIWLHKDEINWPIATWFCIGVIPAAVVGAYLFEAVDADLLTKLLGGLLLALVAWCRLLAPERQLRNPLWLLPSGLVFGALGGMLSAVGPLMGPVYFAYGLRRGAYIGTDALGTACMQVTQLAVLAKQDILNTQIVGIGALLGPFMFLGTLAGKRIGQRLSDAFFAGLIDVMLTAAGIGFLLGAS